MVRARWIASGERVRTTCARDSVTSIQQASDNLPSFLFLYQTNVIAIPNRSYPFSSFLGSQILHNYIPWIRFTLSNLYPSGFNAVTSKISSKTTFADDSILISLIIVDVACSFAA